MALRRILIHPDPVLRVDCTPVTDIDDNLRALAADMFETMYAANGRGLAAPQVGITARLFVTDFGWKQGKPDPRVWINPERVAASAGAQVYEEGCLSIPGQGRRLARPADVTFRWTDLSGRPGEGRFSGIAAVILQHETDHLDGILMIDHPEVALPPDKALP